MMSRYSRTSLVRAFRCSKRIPCLSGLLTPYGKIENIQALTDESIERFERGIIFIDLPIHENKEYADEGS
jgi:hypothetical protein